MQEAKEFPLDISVIAREDELENIIFPLESGDRIFLYGDLGSGKSTLIRKLLRNHFHDQGLTVRSPTYTYFQKYAKNIYHFDLYRLGSIEDFFLIGGEDIVEDTSSICLIEWPEVLGNTVNPTIRIEIEKISDMERRITIHRPPRATA